MSALGGRQRTPTIARGAAPSLAPAVPVGGYSYSYPCCESAYLDSPSPVRRHRSCEAAAPINGRARIECYLSPTGADQSSTDDRTFEHWFRPGNGSSRSNHVRPLIGRSGHCFTNRNRSARCRIAVALPGDAANERRHRQPGINKPKHNAPPTMTHDSRLHQPGPPHNQRNRDGQRASPRAAIATRLYVPRRFQLS
jgi:hypothetical protein